MYIIAKKERINPGPRRFHNQDLPAPAGEASFADLWKQ
jgi:hypothetical protein